MPGLGHRDIEGVNVRELYACQLDIRESQESTSVLQLAQEWVARGSGLKVDEVLGAGDEIVRTAEGHELEFALGSADTHAWTCSWRRPDENDSDLVWRVLLALGSLPDVDGLVRFSLRIRLERAGDDFRLAPLGHEFRAPALIRTLLRSHDVTDSTARVEPSYRVRRPSDVAALTEFLLSPSRSLPVVVVTRGPDPEHAVDAGELARQIAGLAHVEVLSTHLAALALSDSLGRELGVWGGAARLYWPGLHLEDDPRMHRLWTRTHLERHRDLVGWFLGFLGSLGAATVPEHPVVEAARAQRRSRALDGGDLPEWVAEYVDSLESEIKNARAEASDMRQEVTGLNDLIEDLRAKLEDTRRSFNMYTEHVEAERVEDVDLESLDVAAAYRLAREEAPENIVFLSEADDSIEAFSSYRSPRRLYEALTAVSEVATAWANDDLGTGFGEYFGARGYEYSKNNPAATARRTKRHYQRRVDGVLVTMEPHLKVDQSTSPDQCLRIYWWRDDEARRLVIGHVGRHLPD
jgi:hypothetical protein